MKVKVICEHNELRPEFKTDGAGAVDLHISNEAVHMRPGEIMTLGTGVKIDIPEGYMGLLAPRSGNGSLRLINTVGYIDSDYQGEIKLKVQNVSGDILSIFRGDRYFQLALVPVLEFEPIYVESFDKETKRGESGFGSTGL